MAEQQKRLMSLIIINLMTPGKDAHSPTTVEESIVPSLSTMSQRSTQSSPTSSSLQAGSACAQRRPPSTGGKFQIPSPSFPYPPSNVPCQAWGSPQRLGCLDVSLSRLSLPPYHVLGPCPSPFQIVSQFHSLCSTPVSVAFSTLLRCVGLSPPPNCQPTFQLSSLRFTTPPCSSLTEPPWSTLLSFSRLPLLLFLPFSLSQQRNFLTCCTKHNFSPFLSHFLSLHHILFPHSSSPITVALSHCICVCE